MLKITICDDSEKDIELIEKKLNEYSKRNYLEFQIASFTSSEALIYEIKDGILSDIYILDVMMPSKNGIELAEAIRDYDKTSVIFFLTSTLESATDGYKVNALRYIIKLNMDRDIDEALDSAMDQLKVEEKRSVKLRRYNEFWHLPYSSIVAVEKDARKIKIHTDHYGEIEYSIPISEFWEKLNDKRFLFVDRSVFVNIDYISHISDSEITMKNDLVFTISRRLLKNVKQTLFDYWKI